MRQRLKQGERDGDEMDRNSDIGTGTGTKNQGCRRSREQVVGQTKSEEGQEQRNMDRVTPAPSVGMTTKIWSMSSTPAGWQET